MTRLRLLAVIEATTITGPAKNLLTFAEMAHSCNTERKLELSVVVFERRGASSLFVETARQLSIGTYAIPEAGRFDRSVIRKLKALVREVQPTIIQSHAVKSHLLVRGAALHHLAPWIAFHHGYTATDTKMHVYNQLDRWSLRRAKRVVTVSLPFREQLIGMGVHRERIEVLHNAVNPDWAARYRTPQERERLLQKLAISADRKIILIVGRLSREKDHQTLLRAIHELRKTSPHMVHLIIVGEGPERRPIEAMICQLALQNCVTLVGQVPSAEPYYGIADASVLSSLSEGSPNALLESMAARVPAVATSVGGIPEIATDRETALLVPTHDAQRMADAIALLLTDPGFAQRITQNAHELVRTRFTPEARYGRLMEIYRDVASPSSSRLL